MHLVDLPVEVLRKIVLATLPEGFESIVRTCRLLYECGKGFIEKHNELRKFRSVSVNIRTGRLYDAGHLIHHIGHEPLMARYIEHIDLWERRLFRSDRVPSWWSEPEKEWAEVGREYHSKSHGDSIKATTDLIKSSKILQDAQINFNLWLDRIFTTPEHEDYSALHFSPQATITLLTLLPNLKSVQLPRMWKDVLSKDDTGRLQTDSDIDVWNVLDTIVARCNASNEHNRPLSQLRNILPFGPVGYDAGAGAFKCLMPFLAMPQVSTLQVSGLKLVDDYYTGKPFGQWRYPNFASGLLHIELAGCCMSPDIESFLSHVPSLRIFKYSHETKWHGCQHDWSGGEFVAAVGKCCGRTLEELAMTVECLFGEMEVGVHSMKEFTTLKRLEIGSRLFLGPSPESGDRQGIAGNKTKWTVKQLSPLTAVLPESLETFTMTEMGSHDHAAYRHGEATQLLFSGWDEERASKLPNLRKIRVELYPGKTPEEKNVVRKVTRLLEGKGAEVRFEDTNYAPWRRDFHARFPDTDDGP